MGGLFSSKKTSTTTSEPFSGQQKQWYQDLQPYMYDNMIKQQSYTGDAAAGLNQTQQTAIDRLSGYADNPTLSAYASGQYIDPTTNPYVQAQADVITQAGQDAWGEQGNQVNSLMNRSGFWSGSAHQDQLAKTQDDINQTTQNSLAGLYSNAYNTGVNQMLQAQGAQQSAAQAALNAGNTQYQVEDTALTRKYEQWLKEQGMADQDIALYLEYLGLGKNPTETKKEKSSSGLGSLVSSFL